jgi:hypothetical protein
MLTEMQALRQTATAEKRARNERKPSRADEDICLVFMRIRDFRGDARRRRKQDRSLGRAKRFPIWYANSVRGFQFGT